MSLFFDLVDMQVKHLPSISPEKELVEKRNSKISKYFIINHTYVYKKHLRLNI